MPIRAPLCPNITFKTVQCGLDCGWPFLVLSKQVVDGQLPLSACLLLVIDGVMTLALCPQILKLSQDIQQVRSPEMLAANDGCAGLSAQSFSLDSNTRRTSWRSSCLAEAMVEAADSAESWACGEIITEWNINRLAAAVSRSLGGRASAGHPGSLTGLQPCSSISRSHSGYFDHSATSTRYPCVSMSPAVRPALIERWAWDL